MIGSGSPGVGIAVKEICTARLLRFGRFFFFIWIFLGTRTLTILWCLRFLRFTYLIRNLYWSKSGFIRAPKVGAPAAHDAWVMTLWTPAWSPPSRARLLRSTVWATWP